MKPLIMLRALMKSFFPLADASRTGRVCSVIACPGMGLAWCVAAFFLTVGRVEGASVGPAVYTNAFTTQPASADWATQTRPGIATDAYNMDADVNANITAAG